jgi:hypothetical protein
MDVSKETHAAGPCIFHSVCHKNVIQRRKASNDEIKFDRKVIFVIFNSAQIDGAWSPLINTSLLDFSCFI